MHRGILAVIVALLSITTGQTAQLLPFQGSTRPQIEDDFRSLQRAFLLGKGGEFRALDDLMRSCHDAPDGVHVWTNLLYVHLLLENDSVQKAERVLQEMDGSESGWLGSYRTCLLGMVSFSKGRYIMARAQFSKALAEAKDIPALKVLVTQTMAENLRYKGDLDESLEKWFESLAASEFIKDSAAIADSYHGRGMTRLALGKLDLAESDIATSLSYYSRKAALKGMSSSYTALALINHLKGHDQNAIELGLRGYGISKGLNDIKGQAESLHNLALVYMGLENWAQALRYLDLAVQLDTRSGERRNVAALFNSIGICHRQLGHTAEALKYFERALGKGTESGNTRDVIRAYGSISEHYADMGDFRSAYDAQIKLTGLMDSLAMADRAQTIEELEVSHDTDRKEQEILILQQEKKMMTDRWLNLALGLFLLIIIGLLFIDNQKRKHRQEKELLGVADELQKTELKRVSDMLVFNQNKLSLYTENLLKKSELVSQLESKLRNSVGGPLENLEQGEQLIADFSSVRILTDDDWVEFKALFDEVHKGLLERLLLAYRDLSLAEQRLFLLMKLQLSTKEIANILGVSPDSVKKGRYRLKKKVGMDDATSLQDFVSSF